MSVPAVARHDKPDNHWALPRGGTESFLIFDLSSADKPASGRFVGLIPARERLWAGFSSPAKLAFLLSVI
jgi:hypothetical protein